MAQNKYNRKLLNINFSKVPSILAVKKKQLEFDYVIKPKSQFFG